MRVSAVLQDKGSTVATIRGDATIADAVAALSRLDIGALVVSRDGARIEGIVSEREIVRRLATVRGAVVDDAVAAVMSRTVHTCGPDDEIESVMSVMTQHRVRHVPVVRDGVLCGIVSIGDVVKSRISELEQLRRELVEYITAR